MQDEDQGQEDLEGTHNHKAHNEPERHHKGQEIARAAPALPSPTGEGVEQQKAQGPTLSR